MIQPNEVAIIGAIMKAAGITRLFVGNEILEGFDRTEVSVHEDFLRDGYMFVLRDVEIESVRVESRVEIQGEIENA